jgi:hypothetical protein
LRPGVSVIVEAGVRNASLLIRIDGQSGAIRLSQELGARIFIIASVPGSSPD